MSNNEGSSCWDAELLRRYPALSMTDAEIRMAAQGDPVVDQVKAAMGPDHYRSDPDLDRELTDVSDLGAARCGVTLSPNARDYPVISEALDKIFHGGGSYSTMIPNPDLLEEYFYLDYLHSDLPDRAPLPYKEDGYRDRELEEELVNRGSRTASRREAMERRKRQYIEEDLPAAANGPIVKVVVMHSRRPIHHAHEELLPNGEWMKAALVAIPVPHGFTAFRVARFMSDDERGCFWCDHITEERRSVMAVSCGGSLQLFATCPACRKSFGPGLDYLPDDAYNEDRKVGFPAEGRR